MARPDILVEYGANTKAIDKVNKRLEKDSKKLAKSMAGIFGGAAVTAGLSSYARGVTESIRVTDRWARALGVPIDQLDAMSKATKTVGIDTEKFADLLKDLSEKVGLYYRTGTGEAKDTIEGLKLDIDELIKLNPADLFKKVFTEVSKLSNRNLRISFVEELGNDFTLLNPLIDDNMKEFNRLVEAYEKGGDTMTQSMGDTTREMDEKWSTLMTKMKSGFRTMLFSVTDTAGTYLTAYNKAIETLSDKFIKIAGLDADTLMPGLRSPGPPGAPPPKGGTGPGLVIPRGSKAGGSDKSDDIFGEMLEKAQDDWRRLEETANPALKIMNDLADALDDLNVSSALLGRTDQERAVIERALREEAEKQLQALKQVDEVVSTTREEYEALKETYDEVLAIERQMTDQLMLLDQAEAELGLGREERQRMEAIIREDANRRLDALREEEVQWEQLGSTAGRTLGNIVTGANAAEQALSLLGRVVEFAFNNFLLPSIFPAAAQGVAGLAGGAATASTAPTMPLLAAAGAAAGASPSVNVYNYGADVAATSSGGEVDIVVKRITGEIARGGTPLARSLESSYGLTRGRLRG